MKQNNYYRGYVSSRPINGNIIPQSLQNLKYNLIKIPQGRADGRIFMPDSMWANVDEDDFKICLDGIHKQRSSYRKKALKQREIILNKFSQRSIELMYDKFMEEIL